MPPGAMDPGAEDALRDAASAWYLRMHGPDAARHQAAFEAWLAASPNHRTMYDRIALRWDQAGLVGHTPSGRAREGLPPLRRRASRSGWGYAIAAGLVALLVAGGIHHVREAPEHPPLVAVQQLASPVGIRQVRLADGSMVTLDAATRLVVRFGPDARRLTLLAGRARFAVAHDAARPFVVAAGDREIVATGTVFDVALAAGHVAVALLRGGVDVRSIAPAAPHRLIAHLTPGLTLAANPRDAVPRASTKVELAWPTGMIDFDATPLRAVLATANLYSARQVRLGDPTLGTLEVTGGFRMGDADALAAALAAAFALRVEHAADGDIVLHRPRATRN